jgi:hypothetical protein
MVKQVTESKLAESLAWQGFRSIQLLLKPQVCGYFCCQPYSSDKLPGRFHYSFDNPALLKPQGFRAGIRLLSVDLSVKYIDIA